MAQNGGGASSSSSSSGSIPHPRSWRYHVFLNFRGEDTRRGFIDHLYASLHRKGITTFRVDMLVERGEVISSKLFEAIEESMLAIVVLSPNYASSTWCLDELQKIIECNKNLRLPFIPVFYGVEPSEVRFQRGHFEKAFAKHEHRYGGDINKVKRWRDALIEVANYSGWVRRDGYESELVQSIVEDIQVKLTPTLPYFAHTHFGIASSVEEVFSLIGHGWDW